MVKDSVKNFYEIQKQQWEKSLFLFAVLIFFYFLAMGIVSLTFILTFGIIFAKPSFFSAYFLTRFLSANTALSVLIAIFHLYDARKFGAQFILRRLRAQPPDLSDLYHKQFINTIEEIQIASGLPKVKAYILQDFAINSLALIEADKTPAVAVTEGLLADFARDELEAVVAHELAHIARGDTFYLTLVCSLANFFEKLREYLEPDEDYTSESIQITQTQNKPSSLLGFAVTLSAIAMRLLSLLISRQREILADAAAVEFSRNPIALARAIYKAHVKNSFVGDFNLTYSPLFIVPPDSRGEYDDFWSRMVSSHPPLMERIKMLAQMADLKPETVVEQVWEMHGNREKAKDVLHACDEFRNWQTGMNTGLQEKIISSENKIWLICDSKGNWQGPYSLEELIFLPNFTSLLLTKNVQEGIQAPAREFPQIRTALQRISQKKPVNEARKNRCPRCATPLADDFYEGVPVKHCGRCQGKLVDTGNMERILARKEVGFSTGLLKKAEEFRQRFLLNPVKTIKISSQEKPNLFCPSCGYKMMPRPFNYQYFIPVDKCLSCYKIWFDADELEILQILIEKPEKADS